jgi:hypothetical protein
VEPEDLRQRLVAAYGDSPGWEVRVHHYPTFIEGTYGFLVFFDESAIALAAARDLVDELSEGVPVILHERDTDG